MSDLFEKLAAIEHKRWADWQKYMHSVCAVGYGGSLRIPAKFVKGWKRQIATPYVELSEKEKESDRDQVRRYWPLIESLTAEGKSHASGVTITQKGGYRNVCTRHKQTSGS